MPLVPMKTLCDAAHRDGYAVGAFNVVNLEFLEAIVEAAESEQSPVILNIAEVHFPYVRLETLCPAIRALAERSPVPVALNLDHGVSFEAVVRALRNGFTGVMFDGSRLTREENRTRTAEVVRLCHAAGVSVEAELGAVGGDEGGGLESEAEPSLFTDPEEARAFVEGTGVDALAVAIGNTHGKYRGEPKLDFPRLEAVGKATGIPLVLHGGSGISETDFRKAIGLGIAKINFYTGMSQAALESAQHFLSEISGKYHAFPEMMRTIKGTVSATVVEQIRIFGSKGHARDF